MPSFSLSFNNSVRANTNNGMTSLSSGRVPTGKEIVRENLERINERKEARHDRLLAKFVQEEGKGVKLDVSA